MKKIIPAVLLTAIIMMACRTQKTGCPTPKQNWGAERVLDEMSKPKKGRKG